MILTDSVYWLKQFLYQSILKCHLFTLSKYELIQNIDKEFIANYIVYKHLDFISKKKK